MENYTKQSKNYYFYTFHFDLFICYSALFFPLSFISFLNPFKSLYFFFIKPSTVFLAQTQGVKQCIALIRMQGW